METKLGFPGLDRPICLPGDVSVSTTRSKGKESHTSTAVHLSFESLLGKEEKSGGRRFRKKEMDNIEVKDKDGEQRWRRTKKNKIEIGQKL